jgi:hypothetical protein
MRNGERVLLTACCRYDSRAPTACFFRLPLGIGQAEAAMSTAAFLFCTHAKVALIFPLTHSFVVWRDYGNHTPRVTISRTSGPIERASPASCMRSRSRRRRLSVNEPAPLPYFPRTSPRTGSSPPLPRTAHHAPQSALQARPGPSTSARLGAAPAAGFGLVSGGHQVR